MRGRFRLAEAFERILLGFVVPTGALKERKSREERERERGRGRKENRGIM